MRLELTQEEALNTLKKFFSLTNNSILALKLFLSKADDNHTYVTTYEDLAKALEIKSYTTIAKMIKDLTSAGLIQRDNPKGKPTTIIILHPALGEPSLTLHLDITHSLPPDTQGIHTDMHIPPLPYSPLPKLSDTVHLIIDSLREAQHRLLW